MCGGLAEGTAVASEKFGGHQQIAEDARCLRRPNAFTTGQVDELSGVLHDAALLRDLVGEVAGQHLSPVFVVHSVAATFRQAGQPFEGVVHGASRHIWLRQRFGERCSSATAVCEQHELFNLGGELSIPGYELLKPAALLVLDQALAQHNETLPRLEEFILPAGTRAASLAHVCRTVARRAERAVIALQTRDELKPTPRQYLNRLSDLMFVLSRVLNRYRTDGTVGDDVYWKSERLARGAEPAD